MSPWRAGLGHGAAPRSSRLGAALVGALSVAAVLVAAVLVGAVPAAAQTAPVRYRPPVVAPVTDPFRAPATWYGPGNRGIEYDTSKVGSVAAIGDGTVTFAGQVAGRLVVVVAHPDGLRSTYTGLGAITVHRGDPVALGQRLGAAGSRLHLGLRSATTYLDPARYFAPGRRHATLVGPYAPTTPSIGPGSPRAPDRERAVAPR